VILVVDTRNSLVGRVPYDGKARALYSPDNRRGILPWFRRAVLIYHSNIVGVWVYFEIIILCMLTKVILSLALIVDTGGIIVSYSSNARSRIQDDVERMKVSIVPVITALTRQVGILVQKISGSEIVQSDLGT